MGLDVSCMLAHNVFIDLYCFYRKKDSKDDKLDDTTRYYGGGVRINIARQRMGFLSIPGGMQVKSNRFRQLSFCIEQMVPFYCSKKEPTNHSCPNKTIPGFPITA